MYTSTGQHENRFMAIKLLYLQKDVAIDVHIVIDVYIYHI